MKINEILIESQLHEGPLLNKIGRGIGKAVGTAAKGVGAVAGGVAGIGKAIKKGFQAGKATVGGAGDDGDAPDAGADTTSAAPGGQPAPAAQTAPAPTPKTAAPKTAAPKTAAPKTNFGKLSAAAQGAPETSADPKQDTAYAQAQKAIQSLAPEQKKEIVTMLQADPKVKAAMTTKSSQPKTKKAPAAGAKKNLGFGFNTDTGEPFSSAEERTAAGEAGKMAAREFPTAEPKNSPSTKGKTGSTGGGVTSIGKVTSTTPTPSAEQPTTTAKGKKKVVKKPAAPSQSEIDADRERIMGVTSDSIVRKQPALHESFSLFRKR